MSRPAWDAWIEIAGVERAATAVVSRPAWDAWIEILVQYMFLPSILLSRPAWDAWIEIKHFAEGAPSSSRVPHGTRGLKFSILVYVILVYRRVPHGTRGLKSYT